MSDRAQAFTLEGFVASVVVLTAVLFALQSIVLTPTTSGSIDQSVQSQLRQEANDILVANAHNGSQDLSYLVRHWDGFNTNVTWAGGIDETIGYGSTTPPTAFGAQLNQTFTQRGRVYNVVIEYRTPDAPNESETRRIVYRGVPPDNAVVTTYTVTLYDNQTLTGPNSDQSMTLEQYDQEQDSDRGYFPIPDAFNNSQIDQPAGSENWNEDSPIYNVVEVRVIVW